MTEIYSHIILRVVNTWKQSLKTLEISSVPSNTVEGKKIRASFTEPYEEMRKKKPQRKEW